MRLKPIDQDLDWRRRYPFEDGWRGVFKPSVCHFGTSEHTTTQTQTNTPWAPQQPYLTSGFAAAQNLMSGAPPTQTNTVVPMTGAQTNALSGIQQLAANGTPITGATTGFGTDLESGNYLNANPANGYFASLANTNLGLTGPGSSTLADFAHGAGAGSGTLNNFANGSYFSNGYTDDTAKSIMAQVIPQVAASFNKGNAINNPAAARAAAEGVTAALAPVEYQNYQTQEGLAKDAASTLGTNALTGASGANSSAISGAGVQSAGATGIGNNYQDTLAKMVQGEALAPATQQLSYADLQNLYSAGQAQQTQAQNVASASDASKNFAQLSPYQQLQAYMQAVTGNYGGTQTTTTPYYTNNTANTLGTISSGASIIGSLAAFL